MTRSYVLLKFPITLEEKENKLEQPYRIYVSSSDFNISSHHSYYFPFEYFL